jgi:Phage integrase, N-terminal SAM-like domain
MNAILLPAVIGHDAPLPALPAADLERAVNFAKQDKAESTRKAYRSDFAAFTAWCGSRGVASLPATPETVAAYLTAEAEAGLKPSTIGRRCAAIGHAHKLAGDEPPTNAEGVKATLRGIRRAIGAAPARKAPAVAEVTRDMARAAPGGLKGLRARRCSCSGSAVRFAGLSSSPSTWRTWKRRTKASASRSAAARPTRRATASRSPSSGAVPAVGLGGAGVAGCGRDH